MERPDESDTVDEIRLSAEQAAAMLAVTPETLRDWERHFGYPAPLEAAPGQPATESPTYSRRDILSLKEALADEFSIACAISRARWHRPS